MAEMRYNILVDHKNKTNLMRDCGLDSAKG